MAMSARTNLQAELDALNLTGPERTSRLVDQSVRGYAARRVLISESTDPPPVIEQDAAAECPLIY